MNEITVEGFDLREWEMIFPNGSYGLYSGTFSVVDGSRVADVTPERIIRVVAWRVEENDDGTEIKLLVELDDGSFAACMAGCDYTGWDCQAGVEWRWAPSSELAISQGIDRATRAVLGVPLAIDAATTHGEVW